MKIGRNDPCICGSGKKYKKCCLSLPRTQSLMYEKEGFFEKEVLGQCQERLVVTTTQEEAVPVRLYYKINNATNLRKNLDTLKCLKYDTKDRFFISYYKEMEHMGLSVKHKDVPEELFPIILAMGHIDKDLLLLDFYSIERAVKLASFIDATFPKDSAQLIEVALVNTFSELSMQDLPKISYNNFGNIFSEKQIKKGRCFEVLLDINEKELEKQLKQYFSANLPTIERISLPQNHAVEYLGGNLLLRQRIMKEYFSLFKLQKSINVFMDFMQKYPLEDFDEFNSQRMAS